MSAIEELVAEFARLPGIGRKTAQRLTYFLLKQPREETARLARSLAALGDRVRSCSSCGNLTEQDPCAICADARRDPSVVCVVEEASDVLAIERAGEYRGLYHVLGGRLSPLDGVGPEALNIPSLQRRVENGSGVREVILATNPSVEGEATAHYLERALRPLGVSVSRLARGLPMGGELEYADGETIAQSLSARRTMGGE
ncbi:MAG: recombination mediator RecR [Gemmatimonadales bacterium]|nr:recombination mediator RecR [Gemmatimonadales bacterium]MDP3774388.1 recombination mediator RecR [Gemmatimonadales bacterium]